MPSRWLQRQYNVWLTRHSGADNFNVQKSSRIQRAAVIITNEASIKFWTKTSINRAPDMAPKLDPIHSHALPFFHIISQYVVLSSYAAHFLSRQLFSSLSKVKAAPFGKATLHAGLVIWVNGIVWGARKSTDCNALQVTSVNVCCDINTNAEHWYKHDLVK